MMKFRVKGGSHSALDGKVSKKGDIVESEKDLRKIFPNHFELVEAEVIQMPPIEPPVVPVAGQEAPKALDKQIPKLPLTGMNVTKNYQGAADNGLVVMKRGSFFFIFDEGEKEPINKKGLTKSEVDAKIKEILEG